jgi:urease accessory protein
MSLSQGVKHGIGRLTASADGGPQKMITRLTQVSHKAPTRWVPLKKSSVYHAGAAICALSNYGGGMLQGDSCELHVNVDANARLGVMTQGTSRIYTQRTPNVCQVTLQATVKQDAMLVWAPDPCALFAASSFQQTQHVAIHPTSSVVLIDWFSSGRYRNGEHWAFDRLSSRTCLSWLNDDQDQDQEKKDRPHAPFLQDAVHMDLTIGKDVRDPLGVSDFHVFASMILYGEQAKVVQQQCLALQDALASQYTRIRHRPQEDVSDVGDPAVDLSALGLAGRVCMGTSRVDLTTGKDQHPNSGDAHVVRLAATTNEDLYRIFHYCLKPLHPLFGLEFYKERIRAKASEIPKAKNGSRIASVHGPAKTPHTVERKEINSPTTTTDEDSSTIWSAYLLADSALPTGSFAHSAGLEAAAQLGLLDDVQTFVQAATRSTVQMTMPFILAGHGLIAASSSPSLNHENNTNLLDEWKRLDQQAQAAFASNAPACAASLDQGKSLARVAKELWKEDDMDEASSILLECLDQGNHIGPVLGAVAAKLGLTTGQVGKLFGYCVARDIVSAAVRLNLVGPLASVKLLKQVEGAAEDGCRASQVAMQEHANDPLASAAASAPVIEALHPCHELLKMRLFRT